MESNYKLVIEMPDCQLDVAVPAYSFDYNMIAAQTDIYDIDMYTTQFANSQELLDDINKNHYVNWEKLIKHAIKNVDGNHRLVITPRYKSFEEFAKDIVSIKIVDSLHSNESNLYQQVAYSTDQDLMNYLQLSDADKEIFKTNFENYFLARINDRDYVTYLFNNYRDLYYATIKTSGEEKSFLSSKASEVTLYRNIHAHCLMNHNELENHLRLTFLRRKQKNERYTDPDTNKEIRMLEKLDKVGMPKPNVEEVQKIFLEDKLVPYQDKNEKQNSTNFDTIISKDITVEDSRINPRNLSYVMDPDEEAELYNSGQGKII